MFKTNGQRNVIEFPMTGAEDIARVRKSDYDIGREDATAEQREEWALRCAAAGFTGMVVGAFLFGLIRTWVG